MSEHVMIEEVRAALDDGMPPEVAAATMERIGAFSRLLREVKAAQVAGSSVAPLWRGDPLEVLAAEVDRRRSLGDPGLPLWEAAVERVRTDVSFELLCRGLI